MPEIIRKRKGKTEVIFKSSRSKPPKPFKKKPKSKPEPEKIDDKSIEVPGKLEVTLKINDLPDAVTIQKKRKAFVVEADGYKVRLSLSSKAWKKFEKAAKEYPSWVASISGSMKYENEIFELVNPGLQIFEKKVKT